MNKFKIWFIMAIAVIIMTVFINTAASPPKYCPNCHTILSSVENTEGNRSPKIYYCRKCDMEIMGVFDGK